MQDYEFEMNAQVSGDELSAFLHAVYVEPGYTSHQIANEKFKPDLVRKRGQMGVVKHIAENKIAGMMILVSHESDASFLSNARECEFQLLGVLSRFRFEGIGKFLVSKLLEVAQKSGYLKVNLSTQKSMIAAHKLYESCGFKRNPSRDYQSDEREFWVYERVLDA